MRKVRSEDSEAAVLIFGGDAVGGCWCYRFYAEA